MSSKGRRIAFPKQCPRCESEEWKQEELSMYGRYGVMGKGWRFVALICQKCGYSEFYHKDVSGWI